MLFHQCMRMIQKFGDELVANLNCDLENVREWMLQNGLQIHPTKTKYMYIGSSYNIKNKISSNPISINNTPVPRIGTYTCLGVSLDERLTWEKHIDMICAKVRAGIGIMRRMKLFVPPETLKKPLCNHISIIAVFVGTTVELVPKISFKNSKIALRG